MMTPTTPPATTHLSKLSTETLVMSARTIQSWAASKTSHVTDVDILRAFGDIMGELSSRVATDTDAMNFFVGAQS